MFCKENFPYFRDHRFLISLDACYTPEICYFIVTQPIKSPDPSKKPQPTS